MIEKLDLEKRNSFGTLDWLEKWNEPSGAKLIEEKINELVDAVNSIVSVQEKLIDSRFVVETKHEEPAESVPQPIKLYVCPDGSVYDNEDVAKSHVASMFNPLPAGATTTDRVYLEQELDRTKKQLEIAIDALNVISQITNQIDLCDTANDALNTITSLKQKDK